MAHVVKTDKTVNIKKFVTGHICMPRTYEFKGWGFEAAHHQYWPLKKNGDLRKRAGDKFWATLTEFLELDDKEQENYRTGGGCIEI